MNRFTFLLMACVSAIGSNGCGVAEREHAREVDQVFAKRSMDCNTIIRNPAEDFEVKRIASTDKPESGVSRLEELQDTILLAKVMPNQPIVLTTVGIETDAIYPKEHLKQWTHIRTPRDMFELKRMRVSDIPKTAVLKLEDLEGRSLLRPLGPDRPIVKEDLQKKSPGVGEVNLPSGMVSMAIRASAIDTSGGFVLPDSRVDVSLVSDTPPKAERIVEDVLVRAVDLVPERRGEIGTAQAHVTLEVSRTNLRNSPGG